MLPTSRPRVITMFLGEEFGTHQHQLNILVRITVLFLKLPKEEPPHRATTYERVQMVENVPRDLHVRLEGASPVLSQAAGSSTVEPTPGTATAAD